MVIVGVQIAFGTNMHVDQRMAGQLIEHVIEEADAGFDFRRAGSVEIHHDCDVGLVRLAGDGCAAHGIAFLKITGLRLTGRSGLGKGRRAGERLSTQGAAGV